MSISKFLAVHKRILWPLNRPMLNQVYGGHFFWLQACKVKQKNRTPKARTCQTNKKSCIARLSFCNCHIPKHGTVQINISDRSAAFYFLLLEVKAAYYTTRMYSTILQKRMSQVESPIICKINFLLDQK